MIKKALLPVVVLMLCFCTGRGDAGRLQAFRTAAEAGDSAAENSLGVYYQLGLGVEQNDMEAVKWFRLAANQSNGEAQFNLGEMYEQGRGVEQNLSIAISWYKKSCENKCKCGCRRYHALFDDTGKQKP